MKKYQHMTKAELIKCIKVLKKSATRASLALERKRVLHELQVHRIELEVQKRELRDAKLLLKAWHDRYSNLHDFAPVGFVTFDDKGIIREINLAAAGMLGVERTRLVDVPFQRHIAPRDRAHFHEHLAKLKNPQDRAVTELQLARKGNISIEMQSVLVCDAEKKRCLCRAAITDLTARKQAEMAREALLLLGTQLSAVSNPVQATKVILATADKLWKWDSATLNLYWPETDQMQVVMNYDVVNGKRREVPPVHPLGTPSLRMRRILQGGPELILRKPPFRQSPDAVLFGDTSRRSASLMYVPLRQQDRPVGVMSLQSYTPQAYTKEDLMGLQALADHCSSALERIRSDVAFRESEARFRQLSEATFEGLAVSAEGELVDGNSQLAAMLGYELAEMVGRPVLDFVAPESRKLVAERIRTGSELPYEYLNRRKDGSVFPAESHARHMIWKGKPARVTAICDLTERKRAESALRDSEERFRTLFEASPIAVALHGADGRIIETNHSYQQMLGYTGKELRKLGVKRITYPEDVAVGGQLYQELLEGKCDSYQREKRYCRKDGKVIWGVSTVSAIRSPEGRLRYIISAVEDVTERRRAEMVTRELASIVENSADAIISQTGEGTISSWNRSAERIYGYKAAEVIGRPLSILFPSDRARDLGLAMGRLRQGSRVEEFETVCCRKDGGSIEISMTLSPVRNEGGRLTAASAIARDITERKRLERKIVHIGAEERRRISYELHDGLGQTLTGIAFKAKALQGILAQSASPVAEDLGELATLINGAIAESRRLAQGLEPIQIETAGLVAALKGLAVETQHLFGLECGFRCVEEDLVVPTATSVALYRITQEAVHNAVSHGAPQTIEIELAREVEELRLCVQDDGKGFDAVDRGGSGMGLRIMQHRAHAMGGTVKISSQPGQGTRIECILPLERSSIKLNSHR